MADGEGPVTKQDLIAALQAQRTEFRKDLDELRVEIRKDMDRALEATETKILTTFHQYGERFDLRLRRVEVAEATSAERIASMEGIDRFAGLELRIIEIEKRLGIRSA